MRKVLFSIASIASALVLFSCQKEIAEPGKDDPEKPTDPEALVFIGTIEGMGGSKTSISIDGSNGKVNWVEGDEITINGVAFVASPRSGDATAAVFTKKNSGDADPTAPYHAYYSSTVTSPSTNTGTLSATQTYAADAISNLPMYAYSSSSTTLSFKNICSVLAVKVTSDVMASVKSIKVSSSNCAMCGAFTMSSNYQTANLNSTTPATSTSSVILNSTTAVTTSTSGTVFYIAIPAQTYQNLRFELSADGTNYTRVVATNFDGGEIETLVNAIYPITIRPVLLSGVFSVSASKTVQFTSGNLWWDSSTSSYHVEGSQMGYPTTWGTDALAGTHVGYFYWTKTAAASYAESYSDGTCTTTDKFFADGSDADHKLTVDGQSGLYALSSTEWTYLLNSRTDANRFAKARVNGVNGLIIFPDGYNGGTAISEVTGVAAVNTSGASFPTDNVTDWSSMEIAGCVFLPAAGNRSGSGLSDCGSSGFCWSSTPDVGREDFAYRMLFYGSDVATDNNCYRNIGNSLRLVKTKNVRSVLLDGKFTVNSSGKQVQFTSGNLYWDNSAFHVEGSQVAYPGSWDDSHVGHFYWTNLTDYQSGTAAYMPYAEGYAFSNGEDDDKRTISDKFWCGEDNKLTVDGQSGLYALSSAEWSYLISRSSNLYKFPVTVTDSGTNYTNCLIIAPDDYSGTALSEITDWSLSNVNNLGLVCLPAAGFRHEEEYRSKYVLEFNGQGVHGDYWSSSPYGDNKLNAYYLYFADSNVCPGTDGTRDFGSSIRLVY